MTDRTDLKLTGPEENIENQHKIFDNSINRDRTLSKYFYKIIENAKIIFESNGLRYPELDTRVYNKPYELINYLKNFLIKSHRPDLVPKLTDKEDLILTIQIEIDSVNAQIQYLQKFKEDIYKTFGQDSFLGSVPKIPELLNEIDDNLLKDTINYIYLYAYTVNKKITSNPNLFGIDDTYSEKLNDTKQYIDSLKEYVDKLIATNPTPNSFGKKSPNKKFKDKFKNKSDDKSKDKPSDKSDDKPSDKSSDKPNRRRTSKLRKKGLKTPEVFSKNKKRYSLKNNE